MKLKLLHFLAYTTFTPFILSFIISAFRRIFANTGLNREILTFSYHVFMRFQSSETTGMILSFPLHFSCLHVFANSMLGNLTQMITFILVFPLRYILFMWKAETLIVYSYVKHRYKSSLLLSD